jgi:hypothetical protein
MKTIIIYGLKRSGNHFLISSILQQFSNYVHINDTNLSFNKYLKYKNIKKDKEQIDCEWTGFKDVECVLISLENKIIDNTELDNFRKIYGCYFFILLRCPYSNFSSVWEVYNKSEDHLLPIVKLWKIYAKDFINNSNSDFIKVLYDEFKINEKYRINVLKNLGIDNINIDVNKYIKHQQSSFSESSKQQVYKTLENCVFKDDEKFLKLVKDKEIDNLWELLKKKLIL